MASNFIYSTRDHEFILKEWLDTQKILQFPKYKDMYELDDIAVILDQGLKVAKDIIAPTNDEGDTVGARLVDGKVRVPASFHAAFKFLHENGWGVNDPEEDGAMPELVRSACNEYITGANPCFSAYINLTKGAAKLIASFGTPENKNMFLPRMYGGQWSGTMCLTEPHSGSDVGDALTKAFPSGNPRIHKIKGTKCFITDGDQDLTENIIHLLLARVEGAVPGTKGLSLFIVPKHWVNEDGSLGSNDVITVALEHKLGFNGSATAMLSFGDEDNCRGILLGNPPDENGIGEGIAQMFVMMNGVRHETGHSAVALAAVAYHNAVEYAKNRVQGRPITDPKGKRVRIIEHEDIRRMLLNQKATIDAMRALIFMTVYYQEIAAHSENEADRKIAERRIEVLNPLAKAYPSDMCWPLIAEAIQVYGGYGFTEEYPVARQARDCKIHSIWEGTNYIQSMDLIGRKWRLDKGEVFREWLAEVVDNIERNQNSPGLEEEFSLLNDAVGSYKEIYVTIGKYATSNPRLVPFYATHVLHSTAMLYCGRLIAEQAIIALRKLEEIREVSPDYAFYTGKVSSARFYIKNVVPVISNLAKIIKLADTSAIEIPEESF